MRGLVLGVVFGLLVGSVGHVYSAIKKEGWERQDPLFRQGYVAGFLDVIRMAKTSSPDTYLDNNYRLPPGAKIRDWVAEIDELYELEGNANAPVPRIISLAGPRLEEKFEPERIGGSWMKQMADMAARRREAMAKGEIKPLTEEQISARREHLRLEGIRAKCARSCRKRCMATCDGEVEAAKQAAKAEKAAAEAPVAE
jgi:hypothetical protein